MVRGKQEERQKHEKKEFGKKSNTEDELSYKIRRNICKAKRKPVNEKIS